MVESDDGVPTPRALHVRPWPDPVLDELGHDPRGEYADTFWLPLLGPTASLLARRLVAGLEHEPEGFSMPTEDTARMLGLGARGGRRGPFQRTVGRLAQFRLAFLDGDDGLLVRRRLPGLSRTQVTKLPAPLRLAHDHWRAEAERAPGLPVLRERSRTLALTLLQLGETPGDVEAHLRRLRFHPALAHDALRWARTRLPKDLKLP
ncbi:MAG: hypothetical protein H0W25_10890 [Acidimicrobiia bacterium]|nr:hypothetical protein [Acidimicrobiia bacterium]